MKAGDAHLKNDVKISLEWINERYVRQHKKELLEIDSQDFQASLSKKEFTRYLYKENFYGMAAHHGKTIAGFVIYELDDYEIYISRLVVKKNLRRRGIASAMVRFLISKLDSKVRRTIFAEVGESNLQAQLFFKAMGFRAISIVHPLDDKLVEEDFYLMKYSAEKQAFFKGKNRISAI
ncbi:MAG: GNAT family N-acetyltransferase [Candidatus Staskawiczbacteria bacterium]|nr:GNAT family N-acetyltransferase [Candidatus Staskawiczbacteria bacterium]